MLVPDYLVAQCPSEWAGQKGKHTKPASIEEVKANFDELCNEQRVFFTRFEEFWPA